MSDFEKRVKITEKRLGLKLPADYVDFLRSKEGIDKSNFNEKGNAFETDDGYWYGLDELYKPEELDLVEYHLFQELPEELFRQEDFEKMIPVFYADGYGGYVVIDIRKKGFGTFLVFHDDDDKIEAQFETFSDFLRDHKDCTGNVPDINYLEPREDDDLDD